MALDTKERRHVALLDQAVIFPDGAIVSDQDRAWMLQQYFAAFGAPPATPVTASGSIDNTLDSELYQSTASVVSPADIADFHIGLDGRQYLIDVKRYNRAILDSSTPQNDDAAEAGEKSLARSGFWFRTQEDWSFGAGQELFDAPNALRTRFFHSKGADVWTPRQLCMLADTALRRASTELNIDCFSVGGRLYLVDGDFLRHTIDPDVETPVFTDVDCDDPILDWTTDGARIYLAFGGAIPAKRVDVGGAVDTVFGIETPDVIEYANGRLVAADGAELYELDNLGAIVGSGIYTDPRVGAEWVAITGSPGAIFAAINVADVGEIYAVTVDDTTTALTAPTYAGGLPYGETVNCLAAYPPAQLVVIGTDKGLRVATVDGLKLGINERIDVPGGVNAVVLQDRFCWFTWTNPDTETTGLGRVDLSVNTSEATLVPAYAEDIQARDTQGVVQGVATLGDRRYFAVVGSGLWGETANRVPTATVESGHIRFSVLADKIFTGADVRHEPDDGSISALVIFDDGTERSLGSSPTGGRTVTSLAGASGSGLSASLRLTLFRSVGDIAVGPCLRAWVLNALPRPKRVTEFVLPVILKTRVQTLRGHDAFFDPLAEIQHLEGLATTARLVLYQEGPKTYDVRVASVAIADEGVRSFQRDGVEWFEATVFVRLLSKEA